MTPTSFLYIRESNTNMNILTGVEGKKEPHFMTFTGEQMAAIMNLAATMVAADSQNDKRESNCSAILFQIMNNHKK